LLYFLSKVSYRSNDIKSEISILKKKIEKDRDDIHILRAEWAYLTDPNRIKELSIKYLGSKLQSPDQFRMNDDVFASNENHAQSKKSK
jgi:hypothetical protein